MISQSHVLGSRHWVFSFCLMPRFVSRLLSHMAFRHVAGEIQPFTFGVKWSSSWWFRFVSEQQLAPRASSTLEKSVVRCASNVQTLCACTRSSFVPGMQRGRPLHQLLHSAEHSQVPRSLRWSHLHVQIESSDQFKHGVRHVCSIWIKSHEFGSWSITHPAINQCVTAFSSVVVAGESLQRLPPLPWP